MNRVDKIVVIAVTSLLVSACMSAHNDVDETDPSEPGALDLIICEEPRPQICTREYDPVCATLQDGDSKTYATGCTSCADARVKGYEKGACADVSVNETVQVAP